MPAYPPLVPTLDLGNVSGAGVDERRTATFALSALAHFLIVAPFVFTLGASVHAKTAVETRDLPPTPELAVEDEMVVDLEPTPQPPTSDELPPIEIDVPPLTRAALPLASATKHDPYPLASASAMASSQPPPIMTLAREVDPAPAPSVAPAPTPTPRQEDPADTPARLGGYVNWNCPWPARAEAAEVDHATVRMQALVSPEGRAKSFTILVDPGYGFAEQAKVCASRHVFQPAKDRAGRAVTGTSLPFSVQFDRYVHR